MWHQVWYLMGETSPNKPPYLFWSGIGAVVKFGAVLVLYDHFTRRRHKHK